MIQEPIQPIIAGNDTTTIILAIIASLTGLMTTGIGYLIRRLELVYRNTNSHLDKVNIKVDALTALLEKEKDLNTQLRIARLESLERRKFDVLNPSVEEK